MKIIEVSHLKKAYDQVQAVNDVSFYVNEGEFFAFLGSNGAGKSTTIHILCTLLKPDDGYITIKNYQLNKDDTKIRQSIGIVFQNHKMKGNWERYLLPFAIPKIITPNFVSKISLARFSSSVPSP